MFLLFCKVTILLKDLNIMLCLKRNNKNANKFNFNAAFEIARAMQHYNKSHAEDQSKRLQFAQTYTIEKGLNKFGKKDWDALLK